jgi:hypothetical protein
MTASGDAIAGLRLFGAASAKRVGTILGILSFVSSCRHARAIFAQSSPARRCLCVAI